MSDPIIEITPTPKQYRQLCRDLETLLADGAPSYTAAILKAVGAAARESTMDETTKMAGHRTNGPGPEAGG